MNRLLNPEEKAEALKAIPDRVGYAITWLEEENALLTSQDKLSREDERRKMAEWLDGICNNKDCVDAYRTLPRALCVECVGVALRHLREGRAPWSDAA